MSSELSSTLAEYLWTFGEHLHKTRRHYEEGFPGRNPWPLSCMTGLAPRSVPNAASHGHVLRMDVMLFNDWVVHTSPVTGIAEGAGPESAWFLVQLPVSDKLRLEKVWREEIMESQERYWPQDEFILTAIDFGSTAKQRISMRPANIRRDATADRDDGRKLCDQFCCWLRSMGEYCARTRSVEASEVIVLYVQKRQAYAAHNARSKKQKVSQRADAAWWRNSGWSADFSRAKP